jgi:hypothetical protein
LILTYKQEKKMTGYLSTYLKSLALFVALSLGAVSANAVVVFEDNFNANNFATIWGSASVDVGAYGDLCNNGTAGFCVDTEGTGAGTNATFALVTPIASLVAGDYAFSFDYGNNAGFGPYGDNILDWQITSDQGLLSSNSVNSGSAANFTYQNASFLFSVASPVTNAIISFAQTGAEGDWGGTVLDNVSLDLTNAYPVPAPAPLLLLGIGLFGLALSTYRARLS